MSRGMASIVCGVVALLLTMGGFLLTALPYAGALFAFAAPAVALMGIVLGGLGIREAQQTGGEQGAATTGLVLSILGLVLGLVVALTCGLCNACVSASIGPAGRAAGEAFAEAREAAEEARRRRRAQAPTVPPSGELDLGAVLSELSTRCAERTLPSCDGDGELHFTNLRCEGDGRCVLEFTSVQAGETRQGSIPLAEGDLAAGPQRYVPLVSEALKQESPPSGAATAPGP